MLTSEKKNLAVAVAVAACEMTENDARVNRGVEMMLLIKTDSEWKIVAQAWDTENESRPIPTDLRQAPAGRRPRGDAIVRRGPKKRKPRSGKRGSPGRLSGAISGGARTAVVLGKM